MIYYKLNTNKKINSLKITPINMTINNCDNIMKTFNNKCFYVAVCYVYVNNIATFFLVNYTMYMNNWNVVTYPFLY